MRILPGLLVTLDFVCTVTMAIDSVDIAPGELSVSALQEGTQSRGRIENLSVLKAAMGQGGPGSITVYPGPLARSGPELCG